MGSTTSIIEIPAVFALNETLNGNIIQQVLEPGRKVECTVESFDARRVKGRVLTPTNASSSPILIIENNAQPPEGFSRVLRRDKWLRHPVLDGIPTAAVDPRTRVERVIESWRGCFSYLAEDPQRGRSGLRPPQLGAVHAVHAHWAVGQQTATVVMPTGTGKTETMLSVLLSHDCRKLLVVVPTDALRTQIAEKFLSLGILKDSGVISAAALYPVVGVLKHRPKTAAEVDEFFARCNVVVTTAQIAGLCADAVQSRMAEHCPVLFVDESHHGAAPTWQEFRRKFEGGRVLQFTATPFRNDGRHIGGRIIFNYPLRRALADGYFKPIRFKPVVAFGQTQADIAIAERAVAQLREDCECYDHILMARVASVERAQKVFEIYEQYGEFNPVQLHTGITSERERARIRQQIINKEARIVVCVDMLGEGFDLPELKIAAFHDIKKSLAVTLQLAGRFTRGRADLGEPTFVANIGDVEVQEELARLYRQDADWNALLIDSSERVIQDQIDLREFLEGFGDFPEDIPLQNLRPALSTVIYRTRCDEWSPEKIESAIKGRTGLERLHYDINLRQNVLVLVTARKVPIDWADLEELYHWQWDLFILYWDESQRLLFIHGSGNDGHYKELARAVAGEDAEIISGPPVFRAFAGINRLALQNVGLAEQLGRYIRYTMRAGPDVESGLTEAQKRNVRKSNISGNGYEEGAKASIGCSYKGRIWSHRTGKLESFTRWCQRIGRKVIDESIDPDKVLAGTLTSVQVTERPSAMPIGIDWPSVIYQEAETAYSFAIDGGIPVPRYAAELQLLEPVEEGVLRFALVTEVASVAFTLEFFERDEVRDYRFAIEPHRTATVKVGRRELPLQEFFYEEPPTIWFVDGSSLEGDSLVALKQGHPPYRKEKVIDWDWSGTNIRKESQYEKGDRTFTKRSDSIQYRVIERLKNNSFDIIFDDDTSGEAADVVAICAGVKRIDVELYHCKFAHGDLPSDRLQDLYEVCGQAQKCIHWMSKPIEIFRHLLRREELKLEGKRPSGFEHGTREDLMRILEMGRLLPVRMTVFIVQPGLTREKASEAQLDLLSVTENYLMETYKLGFGVIASA